MSSVVLQGTFASTSSSLGVALGGSGLIPMVGQSETHTQSSLAQLLHMPTRDFASDLVRLCAGLLGFVGLAGFIGSFWFRAAYGPSFNSVAIGSAVVSLTAALLGFGLLVSWTREERKARPQLERELARWKQLFYCPRCNSVFNPHTRAYVPAERISELYS